MILAFSGDPFLVRRAAREALAREGLAPHEISEHGEGMDPNEVAQAAAQGGLFGRVALLLDFDAAFTGQAGVKPRNDMLRVLGELPAEAIVAVLDSSATASRQKTYRELGALRHLPTPRFERQPVWIRSELDEHGVRYERGVPELLADLFGEDLPALASEVLKLSALDETLGVERVRVLANRPAARDAFDLIERIASGDAAAALRVARELLEAGESPQRVFGALGWQFLLVAKAVGVMAREGRVDPGRAASLLGAKPFVAKRALKVATGLDEPAVARILATLAEGDARGKSGGDAGWALESAVVALTAEMASRGARG